MKNRYTLGIDYGTESGRAVLVSIENGEEIAEHVTPYLHGVLDQTLPDSNIKLGYEWALQHPDDYLEVIRTSIPAVLAKANVAPNDVIGLGIDFTACTMLPIDKELQPLCFKQSLKDEPHSWVKLWKHHAAQSYADEINRIAKERNEPFLERYGGKLSSEWMLAKIWQILDEAPHIYEQTDQFVEATDWVVSQLTGTLKRNSCTAGYKAVWHKQNGYPESDFFQSLDPRLESLTSTKLRGEIVPLGTRAGELTAYYAELTGLPVGLPIAVGNVDAHAAVPAVGVIDEGKLVMAMGTSICHMLLGKDEVMVEGMCGVVEDGIIPGYFGYEAGQSAVGDIFAWFVKNNIPKSLDDEAFHEGIDIHSLLERKANQLKVGESGLLALDWWNGNRSVLVDTSLSGLLIGYSLATKPEEVYRALLESTAFGTRVIVDAFDDAGVQVLELYACGGLPKKNPLLMQIYADVTNRIIKVADSEQTPALGAAMFAAVAAGAAYGGYDNIIEAAKKMGRVKQEFYKPIPENVRVYEALYQEYKQLHDYFGRGENPVMKKLKSLRTFENKELGVT
ncbi:ribulokinase [Alkalihalobacillus pseudalcaliphilus]|uniref:ribulokinase n=1 Tax=Alkalihalobacillus pseudalcaliphilus TaxID=79884 RepID=UPI00064DC880|nr:ribulokinase [Alkalihalobacillus pseudalcaliphilus]KMK77558.1 ribulokinase [Alkalihalobacillus pseudalcaliphilus]